MTAPPTRPPVTASPSIPPDSKAPVFAPIQVKPPETDQPSPPPQAVFVKPKPTGGGKKPAVKPKPKPQVTTMKPAETIPIPAAKPTNTIATKAPTEYPVTDNPTPPPLSFIDKFMENPLTRAPTFRPSPSPTKRPTPRPTSFFDNQNQQPVPGPGASQTNTAAEVVSDEESQKESVDAPEFSAGASDFTPLNEFECTGEPCPVDTHCRSRYGSCGPGWFPRQAFLRCFNCELSTLLPPSQVLYTATFTPHGSVPVPHLRQVIGQLLLVIGRLGVPLQNRVASSTGSLKMAMVGLYLFLGSPLQLPKAAAATRHRHPSPPWRSQPFLIYHRKWLRNSPSRSISLIPMSLQMKPKRQILMRMQSQALLSIRPESSSSPKVSFSQQITLTSG